MDYVNGKKTLTWTADKINEVLTCCEKRPSSSGTGGLNRTLSIESWLDDEDDEDRDLMLPSERQTRALFSYNTNTNLSGLKQSNV